MSDSGQPEPEYKAAEAAPFPFTTQFPQPGMLAWEDIHFQLVDLRPLSRTHLPAWIGNALQPAQACLLALYLGDPLSLDELEAVQALLAERHIHLSPYWPGEGSAPPPEYDDPFALHLPTQLLASKVDLLPALEQELAVLRELSGLTLPALAVSSESGQGLDEIGPWLFRGLEVIRVYTKAPGRPPDRDRPFTLRRGETVFDLAVKVHRELAGGFKYARVWGPGHFDGQQVGREHPLGDGDVVELHN